MRNDIRDSLIKYCERQFGAEPDTNSRYSDPNIVLRHHSNGEIYAIFFEAPEKDITGYKGLFTSTTNVLVVRCEEEKIPKLLKQPGFYPAYKKDKSTWITVMLSGFIYKEKYIELLREAFKLTDDPTHSELEFLKDTRQDESKRFSAVYGDVSIDFSKVKARKKNAKEEKEEVVINFSSLGNIRSDASVTMEKLLTEEQLDNGDEVAPVDIQKEVSEQTKQSTPEAEEKPEASTTAFFTTAEKYFLTAMINGIEYKSYLNSNHIKLSMLADNINEKMMDITGDTVIEFDGDEPALIEDYIEDIKDRL